MNCCTRGLCPERPYADVEMNEILTRVVQRRLHESLDSNNIYYPLIGYCQGLFIKSWKCCPIERDLMKRSQRNTIENGGMENIQ